MAHPFPARGLSVLLAAAGGLVTDTAFPGRSWWPAAYLGIALLLLALRRGTLPWAWVSGFVWGLGFFLPHLWWADEAVGEPIGWIALSVAQAALVGVFAVGYTLAVRVPVVVRHLSLRVLVAAVLWVAVEQLRSAWPFGGFPWGLLAFSQTDAPLVRLASVGSTVLVSGAVVVVGGLLAHALLALRRWRVGTASGALVVAAAIVLGPWLVPLGTRPETGTLVVGAVQGDVPRQDLPFAERALQVTRNHAEGTAALVEQVGAGTLDVVLWPESAADRDPRSDPEIAAIVDSAARDAGAPIVLGTQEFFTSPDDADLTLRRNDVLVWRAEEGAQASYTKQHPVPFGEYMPHRDFFRTFTSAVDLIGVDMVAGDAPGVLPVHVERLGRDVTLAVGICFEVAYDGIIREGVLDGGELIVVPTNNASFGMTQESTQQLAMSRFRAVEHGRAVVQVSTVGVSGIITPNGVVQERTDLFTAEQMAARLPLRESLTVADRLGPVPAVVTGALAVLLVLTGAVATVRDRRAERRRRRARQARRTGGRTPAAGRTPAGTARRGR